MKQLLVVLALVGCKKSAETCRAEARELGQYLTSIDHDPSIIDLGRAHPPVRDDLAPPRIAYAPEVIVDAGQIVYQGEALDIAGLAERLDAAQRKLADDIAEGRVPSHDPPDPRHIILVVDETARWDRVVRVLRAMADAKFTRPSIVFARTPKADLKIPPSKVDDELAAIRNGSDTSDKASQLANVVRNVIESCPALVRSFGSVASEEADDKAGTLLRSVEPALIDCNCDVDIASLRAVMVGVMANPTPTTSLDVELDPKAPPLTLPADTTWREASQRLSRKTAAIWFTVKT